MHFKQPEILYFLFFLIVPILVHLFQLRRFKKEYFTNVKFLKELSIQTRKSSKIKKWLLLACRLLLLFFIIFAFAQPYYDAKDSKNAKNEMYIILDNSFSMQAKGKKGELLKRAVQELLEETPENVNFSLLTNSENYWNTDIKTIRSSLQNLKYSSTPFQLDNLLIKIKSHKSAFKKDIIIITDAVGLEQKQFNNIDKTESPYFIIPKAEQKTNISIDSVYIKKTLDNFYEISVDLSGFGDDFKPVSMALYNQNKLIAKTIVTLEKNKKSINFTIPKEVFHGYVSINDNGLAYDNVLYFSISKTKKITVLSIGDAKKSTFLSKIYTNDEFNFSNFTLPTLDYNSIEKQDAIVLNELEEIPQALQTTLKSFVLKGGCLILIPSSLSSIQNTNTFLNNFGGIQFKELENKEKMITKINFNHPLFKDVFENKIINFQYPKTNKSFLITNSSPAILSYEDQSTFLTALQIPIGSVFVFSAPINGASSNFQQSPLIVPVIYKMAIQNQSIGINALNIGNTNPYFVNTLLSKDAILNVKNSDEEFIPIQQLLNTKVKMIFNDYPEQAGNYGIYNKKELIENISFNYNRTESNLDLVNDDAISNYETIDSLATVFDTLQTNRTDNQIWKWFLIFALLFLITEMAIIRLVK